MLVKTSELIGPALDWAVARAISDPRISMWGASPWIEDGTTAGHGTSGRPYNPSTDWSQGGPLIDKYKVSVGPDNLQWSAHAMLKQWTDLRGDTPLIGVCRAIVAAKLGDQVDVPDELMQS